MTSCQDIPFQQSQLVWNVSTVRLHHRQQQRRRWATGNACLHQSQSLIERVPFRNSWNSPSHRNPTSDKQPTDFIFLWCIIIIITIDNINIVSRTIPYPRWQWRWWRPPVQYSDSFVPRRPWVGHISNSPQWFACACVRMLPNDRLMMCDSAWVIESPQRDLLARTRCDWLGFLVPGSPREDDDQRNYVRTYARGRKPKECFDAR